FHHRPPAMCYPAPLFARAGAASAAAHAARPPFVVTVSAEPRKNLGTLVRAFRRMPQADLVVIGYTGGASLKRDLPPNIRFAGYVDEPDKAALSAHDP